MKSRRTLIASERRRGAVCVLVAVSSILLLGVLALSIESGRLFDLQRRMQSTVDAAALAAATEVYRTSVDSGSTDGEQREPLDPRSVALEITSQNGFPSQSPHVITVSMPPRSGSFSGRAGFIQVEIESRLERTFSGVFGGGELIVRTSAVAGGTLLPSKASVIVLEPKKKHALKIKGDASNLTTQGDVFVNSKSDKAVQLAKKAQLKADSVMVTGGMDRKSKGWLDGDLYTGVEATPDPYADLPVPAKGSRLDPKDFVTTEGGRNVYNLPAGTYEELKFDHDDLVILSPGIFYIEKAVDIKGDASVSGQGVTLYSAGKSNLKFNTRGTVELSPPTSGDYQNIAVFVNPTSKKKIEFKKDGTYDLHGVIYAPNSEVKFNHTQAILSGADDADDSDDDTDYGGPVTQGSVSASIVARKLSIDKHSEVQLLGSDLDIEKPFLGVIE